MLLKLILFGEYSQTPSFTQCNAIMASTTYNFLPQVFASILLCGRTLFILVFHKVINAKNLRDLSVRNLKRVLVGSRKVQSRIWFKAAVALFFVQLPLEHLTRHTNFENSRKIGPLRPWTICGSGPYVTLVVERVLGEQWITRIRRLR